MHLRTRARVCVCEYGLQTIWKKRILFFPQSHISQGIYFRLILPQSRQPIFTACLNTAGGIGKYRVAFSLAMETQAKAQITECYVCGGCTLELFVTSDLTYNFANCH